VDTTAYLHRIHYQGWLDPTSATLRALHRAHLYAVPFENLDVYLGRPIALDEATLFDKIVVRRRGGFCYELNGLFAALLRTLGFTVTLLAARDAHSDGSFGPEFDHLTLLVVCPHPPAPAPAAAGEGAQVRWLADVGWGDTFCDPLRLDEPGEQVEGLRAYRLDRDDHHWILLQRTSTGRWEQQYRFTLQPRQLADFTAMCHYHQTAPDSWLTQERICTLATPVGRTTLSDLRLVTTVNGVRQEQCLRGEDEHRAVLREQFGIALEV
jgi:N-hydroxyarylamine O-acetyltransferase